ncbi:MAG TPA: YitT family protein [Clostridia bacterium]|nr:YitT family protein [Clostridia bacterium]
MKLIDKIKARYTGEEIRAYAKRMLLMCVANVGYALTLRFFLAENRIAGGGLTGIGIIVTSFVDFPIGAFVLLCDIPIFIWAAFVKDRTYMITTVVAAVVYSVTTDLFAFLPTLTDNLLVASVCGGVSYGVFVAVMARADCSTGGTDLLVKLLVTKCKSITLGTAYLIVDGLIVVTSMVVFKSFELGLYAAVVIALYSYVSDFIIRGFNRASIFYIITNNPEPVADAIMSEMERGVTKLSGMGMYEKTERSVLMTVVRPREVYKIKDIVKRCDPRAFAVLSSANEVMGEGFSEIDYTKNKKDVALEKENERRLHAGGKG